MIAKLAGLEPRVGCAVRRYYDRALTSALGFKLGIGFGCQWVEAVPVDQYDVALDGFLSEEGLRCF